MAEKKNESEELKEDNLFDLENRDLKNKVISKKHSHFFKTKSFLVSAIIFITIFIFIFVYATANSALSVNKAIPTCGDGTFYSTCSLDKPYYCLNGSLVMNSTLCGCPDNFTKSEGACVDGYFNLSKNISLKYYLDGKENYINLTVYSGVSNYLDTLPRTLDYSIEEVPRMDDFKLKKIDDPLQREALMPLLSAIQNAAPNSSIDQVRIAISLVQNIPYGEPDFVSLFNGKYKERLSRYPYQVLVANNASCEGKSELLAFLLREMGYGTALFYYQQEAHEAVGISCPVSDSLNNTGYCFVETTVPAPISYSTGTYLGLTNGKLSTNPQVIIISRGKSLPADLPEYKDARKLDSVLGKNANTGRINYFQKKSLESLDSKYHLNYLI